MAVTLAMLGMGAQRALFLRVFGRRRPPRRQDGARAGRRFPDAVLECCTHNKTEFKGSASILEQLSDRVQHRGRPSSGDTPRANSATA